MRKRLFFGATAALAVVLAVGLYLHMGAVDSGPPGGPGMANDFSTDPSVKALWRFEPTALFADSVGGNTLAEESYGDNSIGAAASYREGAETAQTIAIDGENYAYFVMDSGDVDAGFPLFAGDTSKTISIAGWFRLDDDFTGDAYLFGKYSGGTRSLLLMARESTGEYRMRIYYSGSSYLTINTSGAGMVAGRWYHFGLAVDGVNKTYLLRHYDLTADAEETFSDSFLYEMQVGDCDLELASGAMIVDEFVVFDELRTADEFDDIRDGNYAPPTPGLSLLDGKLIVYHVTDLMDGKALVFSSEAANLLDGRASINNPADLLDGQVVIGDDATGLLDGRASVPLMVRTSTGAWRMIPPASTWALPTAQPRREVFVAVLRKAGLADIEVPMASLQMRRRDGLPTMVSCVVPDAATYRGYAEDREGGELIILAGSITEDGTRHLSELDRAALETISWDVGVGSSSLSLSGYRTAETTNPRPVDVSGVTYYGLQADGKSRVRGKINIFLRPGDTAVLPTGESFVVDQVYVFVEPRNAWMEAAGI